MYCETDCRYILTICDLDILFFNYGILLNSVAHFHNFCQWQMSVYIHTIKNKNIVIEKTYNKLRPIVSKPRRLYGFAKMHEALNNGLTPFRSILSVIDIPVYKLAKFLVLILSDIMQNEFTVKDSFIFLDKILTQNSDFYMDSLDGGALFTNVSLNETIQFV